MASSTVSAEQRKEYFTIVAAANLFANSLFKQGDNTAAIASCRLCNIAFDRIRTSDSEDADLVARIAEAGSGKVLEETSLDEDACHDMRSYAIAVLAGDNRTIDDLRKKYLSA